MTNEQNSTCFFLVGLGGGWWMDGWNWKSWGNVATFPVGLMSTDWRSVDGVSQFYQGNENFFYSSCVCGCLSCGSDLALVAALREWIAKFRLPPEGDFLEWRRSCTTPPRLFLPSPPGLLSSSYLLLNPKKKNWTSFEKTLKERKKKNFQLLL